MTGTASQFQILYHEGLDWNFVRGPRGDRWLRDADIAKHGVDGAYARWSWIAKVNGRWHTVSEHRGVWR